MKTAFSSFVLALPTHWILLVGDIPDPLGRVALIAMLPLAAVLGFFGLGLAAFALNFEVRDRWLIAGLSLPALIAAAILLYMLSSIPPS